MTTGSIYSASDKALFDAINQSKVTAADLRGLFLQHGMIISAKTSRRELAKHFARLLHDYHDFETLARLFDAPQRRERLAAVRVTTQMSIDVMESSVQQLITLLKEEDDSASVDRAPDGSLQLHVRYKRFNFSKSEFRQIEIKDARISIEREGDSFVIRGPQNDKVEKLKDDLLALIESASTESIATDEISLADIPDSAVRSKFFQMLIDHVLGYSAYDVTDVYFFNPDVELDSELDDEEVGEDGEEGEDEPSLGVHIDSAKLKGGRVMESGELRNFLKDGFYISKMIWKARQSGFDEDIVEFEAQFSEPQTCTRFSYMVRGYYEYQEKGKFSKHRKQFSPSEERAMGKLIEDAARTVLHKLNSTVKVENAQDKVA
jgi:hypothetical protein